MPNVCNPDCHDGMTVEQARAELKRVMEGTAADNWKPCGCDGCHWCTLGAALKHQALQVLLSQPEGMSPEKTLKALDECAEILLRLEPGLKPERYPADVIPTLRLSLLRHALWMCEEAKASAGSDKAQRWLGFIQGVIWCATPTSIDRLKDMNRSAAT